MSLDRGWVAAAARRIAERFERDLEAMVAVSSPSGDVAAAEELCALVAALLPDEAEIERVPCSTPGFAPDLIAPPAGQRQRARRPARPPRHRGRP